MRHTTNLCCILFKLSVKLPAASVPPKVSQHLNSPNRSNTSLMVEVMRMEKTINLRLYINHHIFSKLTIKNTNTQFSITFATSWWQFQTLLFPYICLNFYCVYPQARWHQKQSALQTPKCSNNAMEPC